MQMINRALDDYMMAEDFKKKLMEAIPEEPPRDMLSTTGHYETRTERRARERAEAKAARRTAKVA